MAAAGAGRGASGAYRPIDPLPSVDPLVAHSRLRLRSRARSSRRRGAAGRGRSCAPLVEEVRLDAVEDAVLSQDVLRSPDPLARRRRRLLEEGVLIGLLQPALAVDQAAVDDRVQD